ncbi:ATP-binding SpoIIE family protein phosphatase [Geobacter sp. SVR]|uniref:ATP-binding SpoIIE family protein phosphatase n=1 Tax=Geobacter sp. SVR TaxID=2495594 RepID=UPI00143F0409|nr:ATP-binding SpoIIE family protein phosphatase [Geobacter sp. SVR]BCS52012.1 histidine kinase [Geobacter sp. SVR]GCF87174.1 histidine kinase [Geobacter sp. SVR]
MALKEQRILVFVDSDILKVRRLAREAAQEAGFDQIASGEIEIVASELATNLLKHHAVDGEIVITTLNSTGRQGVELRSLDLGPGIRDIRTAVHGGVSTAGGLGIGLSGVRRLMDEFSIESQPGAMTSVVARKWLPSKDDTRMGFSVIARPKPGEDVSGDAYFIKQGRDYVFFTVLDALGHGPEAFETGRVCMAVIEENYDAPLPMIAELCHQELKGTRGAAVALCRIDFAESRLRHLSIGNVETRVYGTSVPVRPFCFNGTLGMSMERYQVRDYRWEEGATIMMYSDGISFPWDVQPEMIAASPQVVAEQVFKAFAGDNDDATVLVGR